MAENKPTTEEHYIPQFYLKNFSQDGKRIYQYDVITGCQTSAPVAIRKICFEKNLYEFKDASGEFINRNLIERWLSIYECEFAKVFRSIQSKAKVESNYITRCFLSQKEKAFLIFFLSTLIVRDPEILQAAQDLAMDFFGNQVNEISARNIALQMCLPIYNKIDIEDKNLLNEVMRRFEDMTFLIGVTDSDDIITSDSPVMLKSDIPNIFKYDEVMLPLSSNLVLYMFPCEAMPHNRYNRLFKLKQEDIEYINKVVASRCKRWIYSKSPLTEKQIESISIGRSKV